MLNFKNKFNNPIKNPVKDMKDLNNKIREGSNSLSDMFQRPKQYNFLIFILPIIMILIAFIPMAAWVLQIVKLVIFCCMSYVLFFEYRLPKKRDKVFVISLALVILFNPLIPFYIPETPINIIAILAMAYLTKLTLIDLNKS